ncbi:MAG: acetyl-CoA carboxylase biotin carboxyl carrier protein subunit, partial [Gemmatimonadota bacterium]
PKNIAAAREALEERNLPVTDENTFLVLACMVPGKKMETNEGIRLLTGNPKIDIPLKKKEAPVATATPAPAAAVATQAAPKGPLTTTIKVQEGTTTRTFSVTVEPEDGAAAPAGDAAGAAAGTAAPAANGKPVVSTFAGQVEVVDILKQVGDAVSEGDVVAAVEAMKAKHDIRSQHSGTVTAVHVSIGDEIDSTQPIMTIA